MKKKQKEKARVDVVAPASLTKTFVTLNFSPTQGSWSTWEAVMPSKPYRCHTNRRFRSWYSAFGQKTQRQRVDIDPDFDGVVFNWWLNLWNGGRNDSVLFLISNHNGGIGL